MLKRCVTCHRDRSVTEFNRRAASKDGLQARCRSCARTWYVRNRDEHQQNTAERTRSVRREYQRRLASYLLEHPCVDCGESDVRCLDLDHEDPSLKVDNVTRLIACAVPWQRVEEEIAKCSVRCANCHRRRTAGQQRSWRQVVHGEQQAWSGAAARLQALLPDTI